MAYPYILTDSTLCVFAGSETITVFAGTKQYDDGVQAIKDGDWDHLVEKLRPILAVKKYVYGRIEIRGDTLLYKGEPLHNYLTAKILKMMEQELPFEPLVAFLENLMENPSARAVNELYGFLERGNLPITPGGDILAYKVVRPDYTDKHSGQFDNHVGVVNEMPRNRVSDDIDTPCAIGFHVASLDYLRGFYSQGDHVMVVLINPKDVVRVPKADITKMGVCKYRVVAELTEFDFKPAWDSEVVDEYDNSDDDDPEDDPEAWDREEEEEDPFDPEEDINSIVELRQAFEAGLVELEFAQIHSNNWSTTTRPVWKSYYRYRAVGCPSSFYGDR